MQKWQKKYEKKLLVTYTLKKRGTENVKAFLSNMNESVGALLDRIVMN